MLKLKMRKILCAACAALLCCAPATGCGKDESSAAQTSGESSEVQDSAETTTTGTAGGTDSETSTTAVTQDTAQSGSDSAAEYVPADTGSADYAAAKARVEQYLNAFKTKDVDAVFDVMDVDRMLAYMQEMYLAEGTEGESLEEMKNNLRESFQESAGLDTSYTIVGVYEVPGYRTQVDEMLSELDEHIETMRESDESSVLEMLPRYEEQMRLTRELLDFDKLYFFDCDVTSDGTTEETPLIMVRRNGEWYLELTFMPAMIGYVKKSKITSANSAARSVYVAAQSALTDMDAQDLGVAELDGIYTFQSSDFANASKPENVNTDEERLQYFCSQVKVYFSDITEYKQIGIVIAAGSCTCVAVDYGEISSVRTGTVELFGTYPNTATTDQYTFDSLNDALRYAEPDYD